MPRPLPCEAMTVEPITPRSRTYYVEVTHHGWSDSLTDERCPDA